jgi:hypothetical protein
MAARPPPTVSQTANGFPTYLALSGNAKRLQAAVA